MTRSGRASRAPKRRGYVLVLNAGSSSLKVAVLEPGGGERLLAGIGERLGSSDAVLKVRRRPVTELDLITARLGNGCSTDEELLIARDTARVIDEAARKPEVAVA